MAICDVCNDETPLKTATCYTGQEFQKLVSKGLKPEDGAGRVGMLALAKLSGRSEQEVWQQVVDQSSSTGWLLCPRCADRATKIISKAAGGYAEFADHLAPGAYAEFLVQNPPRRRWWQFWKRRSPKMQSAPRPQLTPAPSQPVRFPPPALGRPQTPAAEPSLTDMANRLEAALRKPAAKSDAGDARPPAAAASQEPQAKSSWQPIDPDLSCHMPLHLLRHVFTFASGDPRELSAIAFGVLQDAAAAPADEIMKQARMDMISKSPEPAEILQTQQIPERALRAMEVIAPALIAKFRKGDARLCVRPFEDPPSGQTAVIFLIYDES